VGIRLAILLFLSFWFLSKPAFGQWYQCEKQLLNDGWRQTGAVLKAPSQYKPWHWLVAGAGLGATGLAFSQDLSWQKAIADQESSFLTNTATYVGEPFGNPIYVGGALLATHLWACHSQKTKVAQATSLSLQSVVIASGITLFLKGAFHRVRPEEQLQLDPYQFKGPSLRRVNLSFPSGHTTIAFALASSLSAYSQHRWYVSAPLYTLAGITAWSRIYQRKHWPSDVVLGALIGTAVGYTVQWLPPQKKVEALVMPNPWGGASLTLNWAID
jgi:membrane-associated phospholipid phosphatase